MTAGLRLICHAPTRATRMPAFPADEPVDEKGLAAAAALAGTLGRADLVLVSPALSARQTAEALGLSGTVEAALADCDYGRWRGLALAEVAAAEPEALGAWMQDLDAAPHGGEPLAALIDRVGAWLDAASLGKHTIAVAHAPVIRAALVHVLQARQAFWRIDAGPLACVDLRHDGRRWALRAPSL